MDSVESEKIPLLEERGDPRKGSTAEGWLERFDSSKDSVQRSRDSTKDLTRSSTDMMDLTPADTVRDAMSYEASSLTSWSTLFVTGPGSCFHNENTWRMMRRMVLLSLVVALIVVLSVRDPVSMKTSKFKNVASYFNLFVGLLLGFFLTSSISRWHSCAGGFLELFDAILNLQMQLSALGVDSHKIFTCVRYGVLSAQLLVFELKNRFESREERDRKLDELLSTMESDNTHEHELGSIKSLAAELANDDAQRGEYRQLSGKEIEIIKKMRDTSDDLALSCCLWMWVASLLGRYAQDGDIPPMTSPTYGRVMNLAQSAHNGLRTVKQSILVQAPFVYVHTLAILVHTNNIISVAGFGVTLGATVGTWWMYYQGSRTRGSATGEKATVTTTDGMRDLENLVVDFFLCIIGPFLYQVLFDVSVSIAQPFVKRRHGLSELGEDEPTEAEIPVERLLTILEKELTDCRYIAHHLPTWEAPMFKVPNVKKAP